MVSRKAKRLGGLGFAAASGLLMAWNWYLAIYEGYCYLKVATITPALTVLGLGLFLFPDYYRERIQRGENIDQLSWSELLTPRWWAILVLSLVSTIANLFVLEQWRLHS
jgi:O-antigen/teichoic acid export membrane protein